MLDDAKIADMRRGEMQNMINRLFYVLLPVHSGLIIHSCLDWVAFVIIDHFKLGYVGPNKDG